MQFARHVELIVKYNGADISADLADTLLDFAYSDNPSGTLDDLQITLADVGRKWQGTWSPQGGDTITAWVKTINWDGPNQFAKLPCGSFEVDSFEFGGPPDTVQIKALSLPAGSSARREKRTRAWEKIALKAIAADIAKRAGMKLFFDTRSNPLYERLEQTEQADLVFLMELCAKEGLALKVSGGSIVLFDEADYEAKTPVLTIERGTSPVLSYSFSWSTVDAAYRACELTYTSAKSNKTLKAVYSPPRAPKSGPVLKVNESTGSEAEALRIARNRLREQNKSFGKGALSLVGDPRLATGSTITVKGWGRFDGKYIIERAKHNVNGSGYVTDIEIRKALGW